MSRSITDSAYICPIVSQEGGPKVVLADALAAIPWERAISDPLVVDVDLFDGAFRRAAVELPEHAEALNFLAVVCSVHFKPGDGATPFGPMMTFADGRRTAIPEDFQGEQARQLGLAAPRIEHIGVRARLADFAWLNERKDKLSADLAIESYASAVEAVLEGRAKHFHSDLGAVHHQTFELLRRSFQISRLTKGKEAHSERLLSLLARLLDQAEARGDAQDFCEGLSLSLDFGVEKDTDADRAEKLALTKNVHPHAAKPLLEEAARAFRRAKKADDENRCLMAVVEQSVALANLSGESGLQRSAWLTDAIGDLRRVRGPEARKRAKELQALLLDAQADTAFELTTHTHEADLTPVAEHYLARVKGKDYGEQLREVVLLTRSEKPETLKEAARKMLAEHPLSAIFPSVRVDDEGKTLRRSEGGLSVEWPSDDQILDQVAQQLAIHRQVVVAGSFEPVRHHILFETTISQRDFRVITDNSPFVPPGHEYTFAQGFSYLFRGEMLNAASLLIPELENSLRHVLKVAGQDHPSKIESDLTQEDRTLSGLLEHDRKTLETIFREPIVFEIDLLFSHRSGPRIRHEQAHGKIPAAGYFSSDVTYACLFIYHLTCLPLLEDWDQVAALINAGAAGRTSAGK